ncbi:hypothetical protein RIF29_06250 [Crotalaria pallida]|uniref:Disease resistance protein RPS4B/Roq1-like leucine-rich repeats domain-containing protein n=1 Tax=Crotalaria pallida TaxID=3830 RepID=A0AAN9PA81_CROPI
MKNLRILIIQNATFSSGPLHLPNSLRVLDWRYYRSVSLPTSFNPKELKILKLPTGWLKLLQPVQRFESLWSINFEDCIFLTELPSLSGVSSLRHLCLDYCTNLIRIDDSVGFLDNLVSLSAKGCTQLEILVPCINLPSLEVLDLEGCSSLKRFPQVLGKMDKMREIHLNYTGIEELPFSIINLIWLEHLCLTGCWRLQQLPSSIHTLPKLEVITGFPGTRYRLFEEKEKDDYSKSSEISQGVMVIVDDCRKTGGRTRLDVYYERTSPHNVVQVCTPNPFEHPNFELLFKDLIDLPYPQCVEGSMINSRRSSTCFMFRNKFPKITLCCAGGTGWISSNRVFSFKMNVLINGTEQFSSSCTYIATSNLMSSSTQILVCGLECKVEGCVFSECEWNEAEIICELEYPIPCDYEIDMWEESFDGYMRWTRVYVAKEGNNIEDIKFRNASIEKRIRSVVFAILVAKRLQRSCSSRRLQ